MPSRWRQVLAAGPAPLLLAVLLGCGQAPGPQGGCLSGLENCIPAAPCTRASFSCEASSLEARVMTAEEAAAFQGGLARAAEGDLLLTNGQVAAVISSPFNAQDRDLAGGALIDLFARTTTGTWAPDPLHQAVQAVGAEAGELVRHSRFRLLDEAPERVGVVVSGTVAGLPSLRVHTLYELRPCDPGLRIRTEVINEGSEALPLHTSDRLSWGAGAAPLAPSWELLAVDAQDSSLAQVACGALTLHGIHSAREAQSGAFPTLVGPRDFQVFERFLAVGPTAGAAADLARQLRAKLFELPAHALSGRVLEPDGTAPAAGTTWIRASSADAPGSPVAQTRAGVDGSFSLTVSGEVPYLLEVERLGVEVLTHQVATGSGALGTLTVPQVAHLDVNVTDGSGAPVAAEVVLVPDDAATLAAVTGRHPDAGRSCAPVVGAEGARPGCGRIAGGTRLEVLPGTYRVLAHHGPFWSVAVRTVTLPAGSTTLDFLLQPLALVPAGALSAELHVHSQASPSVATDDATAARELQARELEVVVASNAGLITQPQFGSSIITLPGAEFAPSVPFLEVPGREQPVTPGRFGAWPLRLEAGTRGGGLPRDEGLEPGAFLERLLGHYAGVHVLQLQHPWLGVTEGGEWLGFPRAVGLDALRNLEDGNGLFVRSPVAGGATNHGYHAQELFSGAAGEQLLAQRALWFYLLNQGVLRTGTASGFSHRADDLLGVPRSLVSTTGAVGPLFDADAFNEAVRTGRVLGTNGPVIEAELVLPGDVRHGYGLRVRSGPPTADLAVRVSAAPWIPVAELRVVVNGQVVRTVPLPAPTDPLGTAETVRFDGLINVGELVAGVTGDVWVVLEAGAPLPLAGDLGGGPAGGPDGIPDTTDNDGNGVVDAEDVTGPVGVGPLSAPVEDSAGGEHFRTAFPGAAPYAFTNPFVLDRTANGLFDAPGLSGGRQP